MNFDFIYYFSLTRNQSREPEPKLHILAPAPAKHYGSLRPRLTTTLDDVTVVSGLPSKAGMARHVLPESRQRCWCDGPR
jgi:hypothetical protein